MPENRSLLQLTCCDVHFFVLFAKNNIKFFPGKLPLSLNTNEPADKPKFYR